MGQLDCPKVSKNHCNEEKPSVDDFEGIRQLHAGGLEMKSTFKLGWLSLPWSRRRSSSALVNSRSESLATSAWHTP